MTGLNLENVSRLSLLIGLLGLASALRAAPVSAQPETGGEGDSVVTGEEAEGEEAEGEEAEGEEAEGEEAEGEDVAGGESETTRPPPPPAEEGGEYDIEFRPGRGLQITSDDGQFRLATRVRLQILATLQGSAAMGADDPFLELELRRARVVFAGHFFGEDNRYKLEIALSPRDMSNSSDGVSGPRRTPLLDFYFEFRQLREASLRIGQYKLPFSRERVISSGNLQMVDRSIVNAEFTIDRDLALDVRSADFLGMGWLRYYAGVGMGEGRDAFSRNDIGNDFGLLYFVRVEALPLGMFRDYSEVDFSRSETPRLSLGAAYAFLDNGPRSKGVIGGLPNDGGTSDYHYAAADALFMWAGFSFQTEMMLRQGDRNPGGAIDPTTGMPFPVELPRNGIGWFAQAGYLLPETDLEVSTRFGLIAPLGDTGTDTSLSESHELGGALSYYFGEHPFKVQLDYFYLWGDNSAFEQGGHRLRVQLQGSL